MTWGLFTFRYRNVNAPSPAQLGVDWSQLAVDLHYQAQAALAWRNRWNDAGRGFAVRCASLLDLGEVDLAQVQARRARQAFERRDVAYTRFRALSLRHGMARKAGGA